jgi:hypothetical protein
MVKQSVLREESKATLVRVYRPSRFIEIDPLAGIRSRESRFPQYLMKARLGFAMAVAGIIYE